MQFNPLCFHDGDYVTDVLVCNDFQLLFAVHAVCTVVDAFQLGYSFQTFLEGETNFYMTILRVISGL